MPVGNNQMITIINVVQDLHQRLRRLEVLQGLIELPEEWGITDERIHTIMESEGVSYDTAQQQLVEQFGIEDEK